MFPEQVTEADLAVAAAMFPPVQCVCGMCNGEKKIPDPTFGDLPTSPTKHWVPCPQCDGVGFYLREMEAREEHYYVMHLLQTRYQLR